LPRQILHVPTPCRDPLPLTLPPHSVFRQSALRILHEPTPRRPPLTSLGLPSFHNCSPSGPATAPPLLASPRSVPRAAARDFLSPFPLQFLHELPAFLLRTLLLFSITPSDPTAHLFFQPGYTPFLPVVLSCICPRFRSGSPIHVLREGRPMFPPGTAPCHNVGPGHVHGHPPPVYPPPGFIPSPARIPCTRLPHARLHQLILVCRFRARPMRK